MMKEQNQNAEVSVVEMPKSGCVFLCGRVLPHILV